jgi:hypothetical protein
MARPVAAPSVVKAEATRLPVAAGMSPTRSLRRFATWLSALLADDGFGDRFAAERRRDEGLVRRVERRRVD